MKPIYLACAALISAFPALADVDYQLSINQPEHHLGDVKVAFPKTAQTSLEVKLPAWRTGRYEMLNLANGVRFFKATDDKGRALKWHKTDHSTWRIDLEEPTSVSVSYQVYANELGKRARHIDDSHAYIDASGFFMFSESFRQDAVNVKLDVPKKWRSVSGLTSVKAHQFKADNYDVLVDSPIETGLNQWFEFEVDGRQYELVIWGEGNYDTDAMLTDLKKLVASGNVVWDGYPFERYVFMVHATSGARGATEHLNSTIIQRHRDKFAKREDYLGFISTAAHEFIHTWNVKAYRPAGLVPYDYTHENYTSLLWMSEGSTSYLEDHLLLRSGIMKTDEYLKSLGKAINRHLETPGREVQPASASSFDSWIQQWGDHGKNYSTNIYSEGSLISLALDLDLLENSDGKVSYRDVHKALYRDYKLPHGFTVEDVKTVLKNVSGREYDAWWNAHVDSPLALDFDALLAKVGLQLVRPEDAKEQAGLDVATHAENGLLTLSHVRRGGAAWQAGLTSGDVLVAFDGQRVQGKLDTILTRFKPGQKVSVSYFRRDRLMHTELVLATDYDKPNKVEAIKDASEQQMALFKAWLGVEHPNKA